MSRKTTKKVKLRRGTSASKKLLVINARLAVNIYCPGCGSVLFRGAETLRCVNHFDCKYKEGRFDVPTVPLFWSANASFTGSDS